jgi:hypothetical protein
MNPSKPLWKSKTVGFNLIAIAAVIGTALVNAGNSGLLPMHYAALAVAVGNLVLRFATKEQISL